MTNKFYMQGRRVTFILSVFMVLALAAGCSDDSSTNPSASSKNDGGITLHFQEQTLQANVAASSANPRLLGALETFHVTLISGWVNPDAKPSFGLITLRLVLKGDSETEVATGSYTLVNDDSGMGMLAEPMNASLVIEDATLGLPESLIATSGTLKVNSIDAGEKSFNGISISFEGAFKNKADDSDTTVYELSGVASVIKK